MHTFLRFAPAVLLLAFSLQAAERNADMIGELKLVELREKSGRELGSQFSLKEFHSFVLGTGRVPLDILEQQVNRYIQGKRAV